MAIDSLPPWIAGITPNLFSQALEAGARTGLALTDQSIRAQALAQAQAERQAQAQERAERAAERQREFEETRLLNVQKIAQDAAQLQQLQKHQTAQEANQAAQESRLLDYQQGLLGIRQQEANQAGQVVTPSLMDVGGVKGVVMGKTFHPLPVSSMPAQDRTVKAVRDEEGNVIGNDVGGGRIIPTPKNEQEVTALRARASLLEQQYMINNPPKGSPEEKRIQKALLDIDNRLEELTTGKSGAPTVLTPKRGVTGTIHQLPKNKSDLVVDELYEHPKYGVGRWNGKVFEAVEVR